MRSFSIAVVACSLALTACARAGTRPSPLPAAEVRARVDGLKLIDYFPSRHGWSSMWTHWDARVIRRDMGRIRALGGNAVRVIVRTDAFGFPVPRRTMLRRLGRFITLAAARRLRVQLTLFDGFAGWSDITGSERWARAVVAPFAGDRRIAYIDLRNELEGSPAAALPWARALLPYVQSIAGSVPVTSSVSINAGLGTLERVWEAVGVRPDLFDVHYYGPDYLAHASLSGAVGFGAGTPVVVGETGWPTYAPGLQVPGLARTRANALAYQSFYLRSVEAATRDLGLPAPAPWTLWDFTRGAIPPGRWRAHRREFHFGLLRTDGSLKPAAGAMRAFLEHGTVDTAMNQDFQDHTRTPSGSLPLLWRVFAPQQARFAWDGNVGHAGRGSARISAGRGSSEAVPAFYISPITVVRPGDRFHAAVWARGRSATGASRLSLSWYDAAGTYVGQNETPSLPAGTTKWHRLTVTATAPSNAAALQIHLKSSQNRGTVWFDDVRLVRAPAGSP